MMIDFRRSLPPQLAGLHSVMVAALNALSVERDLGLLNHQSIAGGTKADREAGAKLIAPRLGMRAPATRMMITNGTQNAILLLLRGLVEPGGLLVAERLSYGPLKLLSQVANVRLRGVEIDGEGIVPDAFESVCRAERPRALYCNPTVQNPTTSIMPQQRRLDLVDIARRYGVAIIEDDPLGRLHPQAPKAIAAAGPDVTWFVMGTTKCLSHGLRLAYVVAPSLREAGEVTGAVQHLSFWHPAPMLAALATQLIDSGAAEEIALELARECANREAAAREVLSGFDLHSKPGSMHIWLNLPQHWASGAFIDAAEKRGVLLRAAELFAVDEHPAPNSVRMSLSSPSAIADVRQGLEIVRTLLEQH